MRHILILISILLLSSPVIGQETGVLYQYETSSGIQWKTFGDGKVQPKYKGEIKNGVMDGLGVLIYPFNNLMKSYDTNFAICFYTRDIIILMPMIWQHLRE